MKRLQYLIVVTLVGVLGACASKSVQHNSKAMSSREYKEMAVKMDELLSSDKSMSQERAQEFREYEMGVYLLSMYSESTDLFGEPDLAKQHAEKMLTFPEPSANYWNAPNLHHYAHSILGRVALKNGDIATARKELIKSVVDKFSPQQSSFGLSVVLAHELAVAGEFTEVKKYMQAWGPRWVMTTKDPGLKKSKQKSLDRWIKDLNAKKVPQGTLIK